MTHPPVVFRVVPMGKPRMTQRDRWKKRDCVLRYHSFKDHLRLQIAAMPALKRMLESGTVAGLSWTAYLPIPDSWPKKKKALMMGSIHRAKPDRDNIDKALLDALFTEDSGIATGRIEKRWDDGKGPRIEVIFEQLEPEKPAPTNPQPQLF